MAENETRIIKIEIDQTQALKDLESTEVALVNLKNEQKELNDSLAKGTITQNEYAASKVQLDQKIKSETDNRKTLTQTINTESNSLAAQKLKLKELITERDKIDRSTVEGAKKFDQMNGSILQLNGSIKAAEAQGGSFQRNVGNYKGTIDQFTGGAYSAAQGLGSMTKAALAFIATPIGAIIAAIGLAVGALIAYFKGSEEGQNRLNKIMAVGSAIMEGVMNVVEDLGEAIFNAFANPKQALIDLFDFIKTQAINRITAFGVIWEGIANLDWKKAANGVIQLNTGIENGIEKGQKLLEKGKQIVNEGIANGIILADLQAQIDREERAMIEERETIRLEVAKLRDEAIRAEGETKRELIEQAIALENRLSEKEVAAAVTRRTLAEEKVRINSQDKEALKEQAEARAAVTAAEATAFENTRKLSKEAEGLRDAEVAAEKKRIDDLAKSQYDDYQTRLKVTGDRLKLAEHEKNELKRIEDEKAKHASDAFGKTSEALAANLAKMKSDQEKARDLVIITEESKRAAWNASANALGAIAGLLRQNTVAYKVLATADIIISTAQGIAKALASAAAPFIEPFATITRVASAVTIGVQGAIALAKVNNISFSVGGYTGDGGVLQPAGVVHRGEVVWNQRDVAAVGGPMAANSMRPTYQGYAEGGIVASGMTNQIDQQYQNMNQAPRPYLSLTELNQAQNSLAQKVQIVEA